MMYNREGGYRENVRSYYLPGNTPAPPPAHRAHGSTSNAAEELINLTHLLFSARGGGAPPVEEGGVPIVVTWPSYCSSKLHYSLLHQWSVRLYPSIDRSHFSIQSAPDIADLLGLASFQFKKPCTIDELFCTEI